MSANQTTHLTQSLLASLPDSSRHGSDAAAPPLVASSAENRHVVARVDAHSDTSSERIGFHFVARQLVSRELADGRSIEDDVETDSFCSGVSLSTPFDVALGTPLVPDDPFPIIIGANNDSHANVATRIAMNKLNHGAAPSTPRHPKTCDNKDTTTTSSSPQHGIAISSSVASRNFTVTTTQSGDLSPIMFSSFLPSTPLPHHHQQHRRLLLSHSIENSGRQTALTDSTNYSRSNNTCFGNLSRSRTCDDDEYDDSDSGDSVCTEISRVSTARSSSIRRHHRHHHHQALPPLVLRPVRHIFRAANHDDDDDIVVLWGQIGTPRVVDLRLARFGQDDDEVLQEQLGEDDDGVLYEHLTPPGGDDDDDATDNRRWRSRDNVWRWFDSLTHICAKEALGNLQFRE